MLIRQDLIGQRPQSFGGLQLGRVRVQKVQVDPRRHLHLGTHMLSCTIQHEEYLFAPPRADGLGKLGEDNHKRGNGHSGEQQPPGPPGARMHKGIEIAPLIARLHQRPGCWLRGFQTRRRVGLRPMRCWSVVHSSTLS
jgi:hypothetical protein